ncbi:hypothetical protein Tco_1355158 [Tanacetum coccineum]
MKSSKDQNKGDGFIGSFDVNGSSAFAEGDLIGVSSHTGRISKETMNVVSTDGNLVSSSLRMPYVPGMANVVTLLDVPLNTLGDIDNLTKAIDLGKLEVWSTLPSEKHTKVMETIWAMWDAFLIENPNATSGYSSYLGKSDVGIVELQKKATMVDKQSGEVSLDDHIVNFNEKPSSYVSAAGGSNLDPIKPKANFRSLSSDNLCEGANVSIPRKIVEKNNDELQRLFLLSIQKTLKGLEDVLENGPLMIRKSPIILKKWNIAQPIIASMRIESWGRSSFARCLIEINAEDETPSLYYVNFWSFLCICFPKKVLIPNAETSNVITLNVVNTSIVPTPLVQKTNDGFQTVGKKKKKKGISKSNVVGPSIKQNVRYKPKASISAPKKTTTNVGNVSNSSSLLKNMVNSPNQDNITSSNSFAALNKDIEDEEEVENVFDETANHFNSKTGGKSSFTTVG